MRSLIRRAGESLDAPLQRFWKFKACGSHLLRLRFMGSQKVLPGQIEVKESRQTMPHAGLAGIGQR
jgi:hypothetical protein